MRFLILSSVLLATAIAVWPQTDASIRQKFKSKEYSVTWAAVPRYPADAELEVGSGGGHGGTLTWLKFKPRNGGVEVLSIEFVEGWNPYRSKWQPDVAPVTIKRGHMSRTEYEALLHRVAVVSSARLKRIERLSATFTSGDFWVAAKLSLGERSLLDLNWAGYSSSIREVEYAKPEVIVDLAEKTAAATLLKEYALTDEDRAWTSKKFISDWNDLRDREFYWWVAERYLMMIGVLGDKTVIPRLTEVMQAKISGGPDDRRIYYAINAITRLTGKDVRPKPVEEMDLEAARGKVLEMLRAQDR